MVRYFAVVAEHRHFGRAAAALRVAQSSLSRQVRRLEQDLGARLFDRTPQGTELTEAGEVFPPRARALLRSAAQAVAAAHAAAASSRIVIGHTTGIIVTPPVLKLRQRHHDADVRALHLAWDEPRRALLDHRADAVICRLPLETRGLRVTILYDEPRVLLVPRDDRLAGKESVTLDDIAGKPMPRLADSMRNVYWRVDPRPDGTPAPGGPFVNALEDKLEVIAAGQAVAIVSAGLRAEGMHPDLIAIPLDGVRAVPRRPGHPRRRPEPSGCRLREVRPGLIDGSGFGRGITGLGLRGASSRSCGRCTSMSSRCRATCRRSPSAFAAGLQDLDQCRDVCVAEPEVYRLAEQLV